MHAPIDQQYKDININIARFLVVQGCTGTKNIYSFIQQVLASLMQRR